MNMYCVDTQAYECVLFSHKFCLTWVCVCFTTEYWGHAKKKKFTRKEVMKL